MSGDTIGIGVRAILFTFAKFFVSVIGLLILWMICSGAVGLFHSIDCGTPEFRKFLIDHPYCENPNIEYGSRLLAGWLVPFRGEIFKFIGSSYVAMIFLLWTGGYGREECPGEDCVAANFSDFCIAPVIVTCSIAWVLLFGFSWSLKRIFSTRGQK